MAFTIGSSEFKDYDNTTGRFSAEGGCYCAGINYQITRKHPAGPNGNFLIFQGITDAKITADCIYQSSSAEADLKSDFEAWSGTTVSITDSSGKQFAVCTLDPNGIAREPVLNLGGTPAVKYIRVRFSFTWEGV